PSVWFGRHGRRSGRRMMVRRLLTLAITIVLGARLARAIFGHELTVRRQIDTNRAGRALPPGKTGGTIGARRVALRAGMTRLPRSRGLEMSEQSSQFESVDGGMEASTGGSYSDNGTQPEDSTVAVSDAPS